MPDTVAQIHSHAYKTYFSLGRHRVIRKNTNKDRYFQLRCEWTSPSDMLMRGLTCFPPADRLWTRPSIAGLKVNGLMNNAYTDEGPHP